MSRDSTKTEAERILTVLDELLLDLGTLAYFPGYYGDFTHEDLAHLQSQGPHGAHAAQTISDHFDLERRLEDVRAAGAADASLDVANHAHSMCAIVDMLRGALFGTAYEPAAPPNDAILRFQKIIATLRGLVHNNFSTTVEEDDQKLQILRDTVSREQHASADVKALNREFMTEKKLRQTEVMKKDQAIGKLVEELDDVERKAMEDIQEYTRAAEERQAMEHQKAEQEEQELEEQLHKLESQLNQLKEQNKGAEQQLRDARRKKENHLSDLIKEYDKDMTEKTRQIAEVVATTEKEAAELERLRKEAQHYQEENEKGREEKEIEDKRLKNCLKIKSTMEESCRFIQAYWRCLSERKRWAAKKGKGAKGGKKK